MDNTAKKITRMTADEYFRFTEETNQRQELLDGVIFDLAAPNILHNTIALNLHYAMKDFVRKNGGSCKPFAAPTDVKLDDFNVVQPDVFVTCHPEKLTEQFHDGAPDFVAEIVSSNRSDDYDRKLWLYRRSGVREYWIIDPRNSRVLVYFFEQDAAPEIYDFQMPIPVHIWEGKLSLTIAELEVL